MISADDWEASGIEVLWFPGGEPHVKTAGFTGEVANIWAPIRNVHAWFELLAVLSAFDHRNDVHQVNLFLPYLPGARQDRADNKTAFTCELYANALPNWASGQFNLYCADPHSQAAWVTYNHPGILPFSAFIPDLIPHSKYDVVLAPDKGATERAQEVADALHIKRVEFCTKTRDFDTGKLTGFEVPTLSRSDRVLIADDICDGGGTFLGIAGILDLDTKPDLYVTHGIFSKGFGNLRNLFGTIYTTNSWYTDWYAGRSESTNELLVKSIDLRNYWKV